MIVSRILGGLGNQMFQYAFGRALSLRHHVPLGLDVSAFDTYKLHNGFELSRHFRIEARIMDKEELQEEYGWMAWPGIWKLLQWLGTRIVPGRPFLTQDLRMPASVYKNFARPHSYLKGYWQSENLFMDYADQIREDFTFLTPLNPENRYWANCINNCEAISLHVRRGDYVSNARTSATHGLCSVDYYHKAIDHMGKHVAPPVFFVFSDDPDWVRTNLDIPYPHYFLSHNKKTESYNDMRLMSLCRHHIIANSSFSWWGAWLNPRHDKIVIAPESWFSDASFSQNSVPDTWLKL